MSDLLEPYEEDMDWLSGKLPGSTLEMCEEFAERVPILMYEAGLDLDAARDLAKQLIEGKYAD